MITVLNEADKKILQLLNARLLITKAEVAEFMKKENLNTSDGSMKRLIDMGFVESVESLGTTLVITQKGIRALKDG